MLRTKNLSFNYIATTTLQFPDIHCQTGEHWLLLGQSGSGKTTLLQLIAGLRTPKTGEIHIGNTVINSLSSKELDAFRGKNIGIVFQQAHFINSLTVEENLQIAQKMGGVPINKTKIKQLLARLNIEHKAKDKPKTLSQGEQQRASIARALINEPTILLADEPTSALDDKNTQEVIALLKEQATLSNANLLIVTHDNRLKAAFKHQIELKIKN